MLLTLFIITALPNQPSSSTLFLLYRLSYSKWVERAGVRGIQEFSAGDPQHVLEKPSQALHLQEESSAVTQPLRWSHHVRI